MPREADGKRPILAGVLRTTRDPSAKSSQDMPRSEAAPAMDCSIDAWILWLLLKVAYVPSESKSGASRLPSTHTRTLTMSRTLSYRA